MTAVQHVLLNHLGLGMTVVLNTVVCEQTLGVMTMRKQVQVWMNDSPVKAL